MIRPHVRGYMESIVGRHYLTPIPFATRLIPAGEGSGNPIVVVEDRSVFVYLTWAGYVDRSSDHMGRS